MIRGGDLPPEMVADPPGEESRRLSGRLRQLEAPGINTLYGGADNILWTEALGSNVWDADGNRYVDLTSGFGVAAVGHRHPRVVEAVERQGRRLLHGLGDAAAHPLRISLAEKLLPLVPVRGDHPQLHWAVSGSDAVEIAAKTAILHTNRRHLLTFDPSYHGLSLGALALTSRPTFRRPFADHLHPHLARRPFGGDLDEIGDLLADASFAAAVVEPIVGREGIVVPPPGWLAGLAELCRRHGTLLLADEIFTGFGRTGRLFALEHEGVRADLVCCGKALAGGMPIGAAIGPREVMAAWETPGEALHTGTFVAHPPSLAAASAVLDVLRDDDLVARAERLGEHLAARLADWPERFAPAVQEIRGRGLLSGVVLRDRPTAGAWTLEARRRGILLLAGGPEGRVAQIVPALTIARSQLDLALDLLEASFSAVLPRSAIHPEP